MAATWGRLPSLSGRIETLPPERVSMEDAPNIRGEVMVTLAEVDSSSRSLEKQWLSANAHRRERSCATNIGHRICRNGTPHSNVADFAIVFRRDAHSRSRYPSISGVSYQFDAKASIAGAAHKWKGQTARPPSDCDSPPSWNYNGAGRSRRQKISAPITNATAARPKSIPSYRSESARAWSGWAAMVDGS
jgi:hypothetical protein